MKYDNIIKYFETDEGVTELLNKLKVDYFDIIDDYNQQIIQNIISTTDELRQAKTVLTGLYSSLQPIYSKALSLKKQKEYRYYAEKKQESVANGTKFVDGSTTTEAKDAVSIYRDVRDIICGYLKSAESLMYDCKDRIEQNRKEYHNTQEEN